MSCHIFHWIFLQILIVVMDSCGHAFLEVLKLTLRLYDRLCILHFNFIIEVLGLYTSDFLKKYDKTAVSSL
jgi:hypothetical protein